MKRTVLITGATAGIGKACAEIFAAHGDRLILTGRRAERLASLAESLDTDVQTYAFDVRELSQVQAFVGQLEDEWKAVDILINNAGLAVNTTKIQEGLYEDWDRMIDTNVKGLLYITREVSPLMIARGKGGHIINIASIAGKQVYPGGNVYCASKHAVDALSQAMRIDMLEHHIKVTNIAPGMVDTEFSVVRYKGDQNAADNVYKGLDPLTAEDVADVVFYSAGLPPHVTINDLVLMPTAQASAFHVYRE
ncbi:MAG: SDR family NAD(P)-dependent oxidoreductase [Bacteroidota bacterium]